ncbi:MAG: energy transducer TonB [Bacteroidaceae bacterium]|nr:energy transducer TonB [Bacteroidaceae bacterium]
MKKLFLIVFFMAFVSVNAYSQSKEQDDAVYSIVSEQPSFPGGMQEMMKFISENRKYPAEAKAKDIHGKVIVAFVVERDGSLSDVKIRRGIGYGCDEEAIRLIKSMPKWTPGKQNGKAVRVSFMLPVTF